MSLQQAQIEQAQIDHAIEMDVGDSPWERFYNKCERLIGHSLDGDNSAPAKAEGTADGYSVDDCYDLYLAGKSAEEVVAIFNAQKPKA